MLSSDRSITTAVLFKRFDTPDKGHRQSSALENEQCNQHDEPEWSLAYGLLSGNGTSSIVTHQAYCLTFQDQDQVPAGRRWIYGNVETSICFAGKTTNSDRINLC